MKTQLEQTDHFFLTNSDDVDKFQERRITARRAGIRCLWSIESHSIHNSPVDEVREYHVITNDLRYAEA